MKQSTKILLSLVLVLDLAAFAMATQDLSKADSRQKKVLPIFQVVTFPNDPCDGDSTRNGIEIEQKICEIPMPPKVHLLYIEISWNVIGKENNDNYKVISRAQRILNMNTTRGRLKSFNCNPLQDYNSFLRSLVLFNFLSFGPL